MKMTKSTIALVPGAFHGGWYYSPMAQELRAEGHDVFTISLTGLGGPKERPHVAINLDTHIDDVVSLIELENLTDVVLCGHSYGGLVIAGASERLSGRIKSLVFFDALVPADGDSVWSTFKEFGRERFIDASPDGLVTPPPPGVDARARPHPLATFLQPVALSDKAYAVSRKTYVLCAKDVGSPFYGIHDRLSQDPSWDVRKLESGHDFMNEAPALALDLMRDILKAG
jgi:pimeloyl-ACP methyl ester carboxylesterase